jgi:hypothetical protein
VKRSAEFVLTSTVRSGLQSDHLTPNAFNSSQHKSRSSFRFSGLHVISYPLKMYS